MPDFQTSTAVLEIGCEELPAGYIQSSTLEQIRIQAVDLFAAQRLNVEGIHVWATPRRIVLRIHGLPLRQSDEEKELFGPRQSAAFAADGSLTPAGEGFCRKNGIDPQTVSVKNDKLYARVHHVGRATTDILGEIFQQIIERIHFPKTMRWEASGARFARPVRWILALLDTTRIPVRFAGIESGPETRLHPRQQPQSARVGSPDAYRAALEQGHVRLDHLERRAFIAAQLQAQASGLNGRLIEDAELLDCVTMMCEDPRVLAGRFQEKYLTLPREVIVTALREHQRFFAVENENGQLLPYLLAVHDNPWSTGEGIRPGCERVLEARLQDAEFFYQADIRQPLDDLVSQLDRVMWIQNLGSLQDKTHRLQGLSAWLAEQIKPGAGNLRTLAADAARLSKADLITHMIQEKEYNGLQGLMGYYYALAQGKPRDLAVALKEQYLPRFQGDMIAETLPGRILAMADKWDHLVGCWSAGFKPSGTKDPYALRRAVLGAVATLLASGYRISLNQFTLEACRQFALAPELSDQIRSEIMAFIRVRLENELRAQGLAYDSVRAVLNAPWDDVVAVREKIRALSDLRKNLAFETMLATFARVLNILPDGETTGVSVRPELFEHPAEKALHHAVSKVEPHILREFQQDRYVSGLEQLSQLKPAIDAFFEGVLVMDARAEIRNNRLALLETVAGLIRTFADFRALGVAEGVNSDSGR